jgi:hypothetical protein
MADPVSQTTIGPDPIMEQARREAEAFHGVEPLSLATPEDVRHRVMETAKLIARRRGWRSLAERIAAGELA